MRGAFVRLALLGFLLFSLLSPLSAKVIERVIVVIDGDPYTLSDVHRYAEEKMGRPFPAGDLDPVGNADKEVLEQFITDKLLALEVRRLGIKVSEAEIEDYIQRIKEKNRISDQEFKSALEREGLSLVKYRESVRLEIEKNEIIGAQVHKKVNVTQEDVERYYRAHPEKYATRERVHLRHILFAIPDKSPPEQEKDALQKAREILARARSGEEFSDLARSYSQGAGAADGGDIGWVGRGELMREIEEAAFGMTPGQVSAPVRTSLGLHLLKLDAHEPPRILPLSTVREKIRDELYAKALEERFQKWLKTDLRKSHRVDIKLAGVVFRPEETKEGTVSSLIAAESKRGRQKQPGFWNYVNPLYYVVKKTPVEGEDAEGELSGKEIVSFFGVPLFVTESADDLSEEIPGLETETQPAENGKKSGGFFSSFWKKATP
jgi:peptidyl-prolyl cis-trans isomerase SurA